MYPVLVKIFHGPGPRKRSRGVAANASERRPVGRPACAVIRLAKNALCASRRSTFLSSRRRLLVLIFFALYADHRARRLHGAAITAPQPFPDLCKRLRPFPRALQPISFLSALQGLHFHLSGNHSLERGVNRRERVGLVILEREAHPFESVANLHRGKPGFFFGATGRCSMLALFCLSSGYSCSVFSLVFFGASFFRVSPQRGCKAVRARIAGADGRRESRRTLFNPLKNRLVAGQLLRRNHVHGGPNQFGKPRNLAERFVSFLDPLLPLFHQVQQHLHVVDGHGRSVRPMSNTRQLLHTRTVPSKCWLGFPKPVRGDWRGSCRQASPPPYPN